jgi:hypothetical protein
MGERVCQMILERPSNSSAGLENRRWRRRLLSACSASVRRRAMYSLCEVRTIADKSSPAFIFYSESMAAVGWSKCCWNRQVFGDFLPGLSIRLVALQPSYASARREPRYFIIYCITSDIIGGFTLTQLG